MSQLPNSPIRALVLDDSTDGGELIANLLRSEPGFTVSVSKVAFGEGLRAARRYEPAVIVVVADSLVGADTLIAVEELEAATPHGAVIVLSPADPVRLRELILAGARDCLSPPYTRDALVASVRKVHMNESRRRERLTASITGGQRRHRCQVIAVHGAKGGVGTTMIAVNIAVALRKLSGERVAIVDASLQAGDVAVTLNLTATTGLDDLLPHLSGLDVDLLNKVLVSHASGVRALLAPRDLERAEAIGADELRRILAFLAGHFDYIVVDTAPVLDAAGLAALDHSDQIVLVTTPDVPALKNAGRFLQVSRRLGYPAEKIALVVNRANSHHAVRLADVEQKLGVKSIGSIPNADKTLLRAAREGTVVVAGAAPGGVGRSLNQLATRLAVSLPPARGPRLLSRVPLLRGLFRRSAPPELRAPTPSATTRVADSARASAETQLAPVGST